MLRKTDQGTQVAVRTCMVVGPPATGDCRSPGRDLVIWIMMVLAKMAGHAQYRLHSVGETEPDSWIHYGDGQKEEVKINAELSGRVNRGMVLPFPTPNQDGPAAWEPKCCVLQM